MLQVLFSFKKHRKNCTNKQGFSVKYLNYNLVLRNSKLKKEFNKIFKMFVNFFMQGWFAVIFLL